MTWLPPHATFTRRGNKILFATQISMQMQARRRRPGKKRRAGPTHGSRKREKEEEPLKRRAYTATAEYGLTANGCGVSGNGTALEPVHGSSHHSAAGGASGSRATAGTDLDDTVGAASSRELSETIPPTNVTQPQLERSSDNRAGTKLGQTGQGTKLKWPRLEHKKLRQPWLEQGSDRHA